MTILKMLLNAVGYGRVSTGGQDEALSVDTQAAKMDDKAEEEGFQIIRLFRETGSGTSVRKRLAFQAMIQFVLNPANNIKAVFFYDPSRYTRDITDFYIYLRQLTKAGIKVYSVTLGQYKPGDEMSEITWGFNALFNSIMPRQAARKTRDTQVQATLMGYYLSPYTPFGFEKYKITVEKKEHTKLRPHPEQWEHALKMWEMGLAKYTPTQVAQYNNDLGIRNNKGNDWTDANSAGLLSKPRMQRSNRQGQGARKRTHPKRRAIGSMRERASGHGDPGTMGQGEWLHSGEAQCSGRAQEPKQSQPAQREDILRALRITHARRHEQ